jgi:hypothetical protein
LSIDKDKIIQSIIESSRVRDSKGILPSFGVYFSFFFVQYYTSLAFQFKKSIAEQGDAGQKSLVRLAQYSSYQTFHRICSSWEWKEVVEPEIESKEDQVHGLVAVNMALGWGALEIRSLIPERELVVRVSDSSEANGYLKEFGRADAPQCHMLQGAMGAIMDLLYARAYPKGCYSFATSERACRAQGDPYCEFVSWRQNEAEDAQRLGLANE